MSRSRAVLGKSKPDLAGNGSADDDAFFCDSLINEWAICTHGDVILLAVQFERVIGSFPRTVYFQVSIIFNSIFDENYLMLLIHDMVLLCIQKQ
jgi:hypothetical protein